MWSPLSPFPFARLRGCWCSGGGDGRVEGLFDAETGDLCAAGSFDDAVADLPVFFGAGAGTEGVRIAGRLAGVAVLGHLILLFLGMAVVMGWLVVEATGIVGGPHDYAELWWLLLGIPVLLLIMLLKDLTAFLFWVCAESDCGRSPACRFAEIAWDFGDWERLMGAGGALRHMRHGV